MKALLLWPAACVLIHAATVEQLVEQALASSPALITIEEQIAASHEAVTLSRALDNPVLSLSVNALSVKEPSNRSLERMQSTGVTLQQRLPFPGKRDLLEEAARAKNDLLDIRLDDAKTALAASVRMEAYTLWKLRELLELEERNTALMRHNAELFQTYGATSEGAHMGLMAAELAASASKLSVLNLGEQIAKQEAKIAYLVGGETGTIEVNLAAPRPPDPEQYRSRLERNYTFGANRAALHEADATARYEAMRIFPDTTLSLGYFNREAFDDYLSFSLSVPLPVYGSESRKEEIARRKKLEQEQRNADAELKVHRDFESAAAALTSSYERYRILNDDSLPQLEHMSELASASMMAGENQERTVELLGKKLQLEKERAAAIADYYRAQALLEALTGAL